MLVAIINVNRFVIQGLVDPVPYLVHVSVRVAKQLSISLAIKKSLRVEIHAIRFLLVASIDAMKDAIRVTVLLVGLW